MKAFRDRRFGSVGGNFRRWVKVKAHEQSRLRLVMEGCVIARRKRRLGARVN